MANKKEITGSEGANADNCVKAPCSMCEALHEENQRLRQLLHAECECLFRYVPLSCALNAAIMDDWFKLAKELERLDLFPDKPGRK